MSDVVVLLSGGLDSTACLYFYREQRRSVSALFVDFGQPARERERWAAEAISLHTETPLVTARIDGIPEIAGRETPGRNTLLVSTALMVVPPETRSVALGIHAGTPYPDCTPDFVQRMNALLDLATDGRVVLAAPFVHWSKVDIWDFLESHSAPTELTWSCEYGRETPCGTCPTCLDLDAMNDR